MAFKDILKPVFISFSAAFILLGLVYVIIRSIPKAAFVSAIIWFIVSNYSYFEKVIQKIIPSLRYCQIIILLILSFCFIAILVKEKFSQESAEVFLRVPALILSLLLIFDFLNNFRNIPSAGKSEEPEIQTIKLHSSEDNLPNFYYLLFDEYAGFTQIKERFGYDNSDFGTWLEQKGFTLSYDSHNESIHTKIVTSNIVNLNYSSDPTTDNSILSRTNGPLFQLLEQNGYQIIGGPGSDFYGLDSDYSAVSSLPQTIEGHTVSDLILGNSILYPFFEKNSNKVAREVQETIDALKNLNYNAFQNTFYLAHIKAPHIPYVFQADGTINTHSNFYNQSTPFHYVQYHHYITSQIKEIIETILSKDPHSVIYLFSDHGCKYMKDTPFDERTNILSAVYYSGEPMDEIRGQSSVNTIRLILNHLIGTDFQTLEVPRYEE